MAKPARRPRAKFKLLCNSLSILTRSLESRRQRQRIVQPLSSELAGAALAPERNDLRQNATALAEDAHASYLLHCRPNFQ